MNQFSATTESTAVVHAPRERIWAALTDPELLPVLTPLLRDIAVDSDDPGRWQWHMAKISALGVSIAPSFTERMEFDQGESTSSIRYRHDPPAGVTERAGAQGWYELTDVDGGTRLAISLTLTVELPLPRATAGAVQRVMSATMARTGDRFAANLLKHLGVAEPSGARR